MRPFAVLAAAAVLAACLAVSAPALTPTKVVKIGDFFYSPKRLTVHKGTRVAWHWAGYLLHNVAVRRGPVRFHSPTQVRGSFSHVFATRGTYTLYCTLHPLQMRETITVR